MYQQYLAAGLRPEPQEEHSAFPESLTAIDGHGMENFLAGIRSALWLGLVKKSRVRCLGRNGKGK